MSKIDITSTAIEKGIDIAKNFLEKLVGPSIEETGLLIKEKITYLKFKNQVRMLNKAKEYCEKSKINPKIISLKILCPLLDYSALEENEKLQDKWAILLSNLVDSDQNIQNHVFPYILSQISLDEFVILERAFDDKNQRQEKFRQELYEFKKDLPNKIEYLRSELNTINAKIDEFESEYDEKGTNKFLWKLKNKKQKILNEIDSLINGESYFLNLINEPQNFQIDDLREFEISNLMRLALIRYFQRPYANSQTLEIPYTHEPEYRLMTTYTNIDLNIDIKSEDKYLLTVFGELFIKSCKTKEN